MIVFPETPKPSYPLVLESSWKNNIHEMETGREVRGQVWTRDRRSIKLKYDPLSQANVDTLFNFHITTSGAYDPFWFFWPHKLMGGTAYPSYAGEYVGRGDGITTIFELPSKNTSSSSVVAYKAGIVTAVTFLSGGGDAGADRIQFAAAPAAGDFITADFSGQLRLKVKFQNDKCSKEMFQYLLYTMGIELSEVRI